MRLLIDTQLVLWSVLSDSRLSDRAKNLLEHPDSEIFVSVVSLWEVAIKFNLGRLTIGPVQLARELRESRFNRLDIEDSHLDQVSRLSRIHGDPFDRMLVSQSISEPMHLLTSDRRLEAYGLTIMIA